MKSTEMKAEMDNAELWKRLDELERQEEDDNQQEGDSQQGEDEVETNAVATTASNHKRTTTNIINISHTSLPTAHTSINTLTAPGLINSPADICVSKTSTLTDSAVNVEEPSVISKSVHWSTDVTSLPQEGTVSTVPKIKPFTGSVVEKSDPTAVITVSDLYHLSFLKYLFIS